MWGSVAARRRLTPNALGSQFADGEEVVSYGLAYATVSSYPSSMRVVSRVDRMGYKVLWTPEAWGRAPFAHGGYLLAKTDRLIYLTGIAILWDAIP